MGQGGRVSDNNGRGNKGRGREINGGRNKGRGNNSAATKGLEETNNIGIENIRGRRGVINSNIIQSGRGRGRTDGRGNGRVNNQNNNNNLNHNPKIQ
jgi:hypothetical protein